VASSYNLRHDRINFLVSFFGKKFWAKKSFWPEYLQNCIFTFAEEVIMYIRRWVWYDRIFNSKHFFLGEKTSKTLENGALPGIKNRSLLN